MEARLEGWPLEHMTCQPSMLLPDTRKDAYPKTT